MARECAQGLIDAHRITEDGIFRTLALGVRVSRAASLAREAMERTITSVVADIERDNRLQLTPRSRTVQRRRAAPVRAAS